LYIEETWYGRLKNETEEFTFKKLIIHRNYLIYMYRAKKKKDKSIKPRQARNLVTVTPFENDRGRAVPTVGVPTGGRKSSVGIGGGGDGGTNRELSKARTLTAPLRSAGELNLVPTTDVSKWAQGLEKYEQWEQVLATQEQELAADVHESRSIQPSTGKVSPQFLADFLPCLCLLIYQFKNNRYYITF
jgi:hypothetical protein